jgi:hypothetical protein
MRPAIRRVGSYFTRIDQGGKNRERRRMPAVRCARCERLLIVTAVIVTAPAEPVVEVVCAPYEWRPPESRSEGPGARKNG